MKKIILALLISFTSLSADYVIKPDGSLTRTTTQPPAAAWVEVALPTKAFNVLDYGLKGDGVTDDSAALKELAKNTNVTNWYFPSGKIFSLYAIDIPSHVVAVYGPGTIKSITKDVGMSRSAFFQISPHTGYLVDGLTFIDDGSDTFDYQGHYGMMCIEPWFGIVSGVEVRNCTFDGTDSRDHNPSNNMYGKDGFSLQSNTDNNRYIRDIWIHDNTFLNIAGAGHEIGQRGPVDADGTLNAIGNIRINNNTYEGRAWAGVSISQVRNEVLIENNTLNNISWGVEINQAKDTIVRYNNFSNMSEYISNGGQGWNSPEYDDINSPNINWVYNNHMESPDGSIFIYGGSSTEYYENFIEGAIMVNGRKSSVDGVDGVRSGAIHDNTIVVQSDAIGGPGRYLHILDVYTVDDSDFSAAEIPYYNNDTYYTGTRASTPAKLDLSCGVDVAITNIINNVHTTDCVTTGTNATISGNTCNKNYYGVIPTSRPGAGLQ